MSYSQKNHKNTPLVSKPKKLNKNEQYALIRRFWNQFIIKYWKRLLITLALSALVAATAAGYSALIGFVVDYLGNLGKDTQSSATQKIIKFVLSISGLIILAGFTRAIALYLQTLSANAIALSIVRDLQKTMFYHLLKADYVRFQIENTGSLVSRFMNDVNLVSQALLRSINNLARDSLTILGLIALMLYMDWMLTLIVLVVYPIAFFPIIKISRMLRRESSDTQQYLGKITAFLTESFKAARFIRSYNLQNYEQNRAGNAFEKRKKHLLKLVSLHAGVDPILEALTSIAIVGILTFGVWRTSTGATSYGNFATVLTAIALGAGSVRALGTLNNVIQEGLAALSRIFNLLDEDPKIKDPIHVQPVQIKSGHIQFKNVSFTYSKDQTVLANLNLDIQPKKITAIVGASGAGKTTLMNLILRLYDPDSGQILIDGQDIKHITLNALRDKIAHVSQDIILFNESISTNIKLGRLNAEFSEIEMAAKSAAAHSFITDMPEHYQTFSGESGEKLSGGQKQRIALARAILRKSPILLLDEVTSALDAESEHYIQTELKKLAKEKTVLVIAHRLSTVQAADWIYVLDQGAVKEQGTHQSLIKQKGIYARLCEIQFSKKQSPIISS